jgi:hypothetical protein
LLRHPRFVTTPVRASGQTVAASNLGRKADPGLVFGLTPEVRGCARPNHGLTPRGHLFEAGMSTNLDESQTV